MKSKKASESYTLMTEFVLPNDTNTLGYLAGGRLLHWMDVASAISAQRASNRTVVTVSVDFVEFKEAIPEGTVVTIQAQVTRAFTTSMEVRLAVNFENMLTGEKKKSNIAFYTFVAVDQSGSPIPVNQIEPVTEEEKLWYEEALRRREVRLILSGSMKPEHTKSLRKLFGLEE